MWEAEDRDREGALRSRENGGDGLVLGWALVSAGVH